MTPITGVSLSRQQRLLNTIQRSKAIVPPAKVKQALKLKQGTQEFESVFLQYLLGTMKESVLKSNFFGEDKSTQMIIEDMYNEALAKEMSKAGGIGLANLLYNQLVKSL